jgi:hypothetical protein
MNDLTDAIWHKSSHSGGGNNCVEVATNLLGTHGNVYVRDTKDPEGPVQQYNHSEWRAFLNGVRDGEFDV